MLGEVRPDLDEPEESLLFIGLGNGMQEVALARHLTLTVDDVGDSGMAFLRGAAAEPVRLVPAASVSPGTCAGGAGPCRSRRRCFEVYR